jgi:3-oxoacid CoA-transferase subunit A
MAAGYGMPAIFTPAGVGTEVAEGKETRVFNGKEYLMEYAFDADFAIVKAWKGDTDGNLIFAATARNFNPLMACLFLGSIHNKTDVISCWYFFRCNK